MRSACEVTRAVNTSIAAACAVTSATNSSGEANSTRTQLPMISTPEPAGSDR